MRRSEKLPRAKKDSIIIRQLADETLAYDLKRHRAFCLNDLAGRIWRRCDGATTLAAAQRAIAAETGQPVSAEVMVYGLRQLSKARLLEPGDIHPQSLSAPADQPRQPAPDHTGIALSRRDLVRRLGLGAAVLLPVVSMVIAPTAASAATCRAKGQPCNPLLPGCCSGSCSSTNPNIIGTCA